ncbi:MAG: TPM domain-containing protein [Oscillospiraceae bacterium]|nr:TPM domain-containing protein [Oscillospiraceae bacterium]
MKKSLCIVCAAVLCLCLSVTIFGWSNTPLLVDDADLLTESEESSLLSTLEDISEYHKMDIVVVTTNSLGAKTAQDYADDWYDYNGYADDGVLLLVCMGTREWHISTSGYGITAVTDAGIDYIEDCFLDDLSQGYYYDSFMTFAGLCDDYIEQARNGEPYDVSNLPKVPFSFGKSLLVALAIGFVLALVITEYMRNELKTVKNQIAATEYVKNGSMNITHSTDLYLYRHVSRRLRPKQTSSGGSRTHTSSSGRSHGGRGGRF